MAVPQVLIIRDAQMEALRRSRVDPFRRRARESLKSLVGVSRLRLDDESIDRLVDLGIDRSPAYGFSSEKEVFSLVAAMMVFGPGFASGPMKSHFARLVDPLSPRPAEFRAADIFEDVRRRLEQNPDFVVGELGLAPVAEGPK